MTHSTKSSRLIDYVRLLDLFPRLHSVGLVLQLPRSRMQLMQVQRLGTM